MGKNTQSYLQGFFDKMREDMKIEPSPYRIDDALEQIEYLRAQLRILNDELRRMNKKVMDLEKQIQGHTHYCGK
jgi:predicted RNase H-like nuclease (RuvC/YqgF family)